VNAIEFRKLLTRRKVDAPEPLVAAYPERLERAGVAAVS
jgi:hypothetical protein